jgi:hypothetical protein
LVGGPPANDNHSLDFNPLQGFQFFITKPVFILVSSATPSSHLSNTAVCREDPKVMLYSHQTIITLAYRVTHVRARGFDNDEGIARTNQP